jgi:hypothetical protein
LQNSSSYASAFIVNALFPDQNYATSDFDARHIINANWVVGLPLGRGKRFLSNAGGVLEQVFGGWQSTGIFRWNSGLPIQTPFDCCVWATNWNVQSNGVRVQPVQSSPTRNGPDGQPNVFSDRPLFIRASGMPDRAKWATEMSFVVRDTFLLTWTLQVVPNQEGHNLQFRWEVFQRHQHAAV